MAIHKIKIYGLGDIVLKGENPEAGKDYLVSIRAEVKKIEKDISDIADPFYLFKMYYKNTENIQEIGTSRKLKVEHGKTWAQKIRWVLESLGTKKGIDPDLYYEQEQKRRLAEILNELEE